MLQQLDRANIVRRMVAPHTAQKHKAKFGQFMTPSSVARFMASLFPASTLQTCRLLDAGAGVGALSCAFLDRWVAGGFGFDAVEATAYEIDANLRGHLAQHLTGYRGVTPRIISGDYIELATANDLFTAKQPTDYTHAILNPPYKKINSNSSHRLALRRVGIETVNLYSAFVALAIAQAAPGGQIVAIIPRSFCNGPYYRPFRDFILERTAIRRMHLFVSRNKAFKDDGVLQENIIIHLERGGLQEAVTVSTSTDDTFTDLTSHEHPFDRIVFQDDRERFIHVPTSPEKSAIELSPAICYTLTDLGIKVSTGPVVDFRLKEHLRDMPGRCTVPLLYPSHFSSSGTTWPIEGMKKPNAIGRTACAAGHRQIGWRRLRPSAAGYAGAGNAGIVERHFAAIRRSLASTAHRQDRRANHRLRGHWSSGSVADVEQTTAWLPSDGIPCRGLPRIVLPEFTVWMR